VYSSATLSLAALELLAHLTRNVEAPSDLVAVAAEVPDRARVIHVRVEDLPTGWRRAPAPPGLADIGDRWIRESASAVLAVPSAIIPNETNYLLNPRHPTFRTIRVRRPQPFSFDPRLL
jgi:RES domain-containing protein